MGCSAYPPHLGDTGERTVLHSLKEAAECCKKLDVIIAEQEIGVALREDYDARHPDEVHASGDYL